MSDMRGKAQELYALEQLSGGTSILHRLHPGVKIIAAFVFMVAVISFDRYRLGPLMPFLFYPCVLIALAELPLGLLMRRTALALPFCLFAGLSNLFLERRIAFTLGVVPVSFGFLSLCALLLRTLLCVAAVLILIATTPWARLSAQLRRFHLPAVFVTLLEICYRYISVLLGEAESMYVSYRLRAGNVKGIALVHMGSFVGRLFLRSVDRAERVYAAMKCRGYSPDKTTVQKQRLHRRDAVFLFLVIFCCVLFRFINVPVVMGMLIGRVASL